MVTPENLRMNASPHWPAWLRLFKPWPLASLLKTRKRTALALFIGALVYAALVAALLYLALQTEHSRVQTELDRDSHDIAQELRTRLSAIAPALQQLERNGQPPLREPHVLNERVYALFDDYPELARVELRSRDAVTLIASANRRGADLGARANRTQLEEVSNLACQAAQLREEPQFSTSTFIPSQTVGGFESIDLCVPISGQAEREMWVVTISLSDLLRTSEEATAGQFSSVFLSDPDGSRLATISRGVRSVKDLNSSALIVLPGAVLTLGLLARHGLGFGFFSAFSVMAAAFSLLLFLSVLLLARDILRRQRAESALSQALGFRKAMEDSLITGLRARDLQGKITYVNPAFCELVGYTPEQLVGQKPPMPYWPPESHAEYEQRFARRTAGAFPRDVFETEYQHASSKRLPVLIYEAPLVDAQGQHTGWMASVLDMSEQRRMEGVARAQQDKLAEASRLTTVGELASTLSHELNQPLAAIASFAAAGRNLLEANKAATTSDVKEIMRNISAQAERAGRVIKSVRGFVRRGDGERQPVDMSLLLKEILPLLQLQARAAKAQVNLTVRSKLPLVLGDRTLLEQVLLNLSRNGFEAMAATPLSQRKLEVSAEVDKESQVLTISVLDVGAGIDAKAAEQLFSPFFTTKHEGMGLGLSICRNVIEQHGGSIHAEPYPNSPTGTGTVFRFTLPPHDRLSRR
jgi:two-component system, LuxR family, sensor histidine kinase DctS